MGNSLINIIKGFTRRAHTYSVVVSLNWGGEAIGPGAHSESRGRGFAVAAAWCVLLAGLFTAGCGPSQISKGEAREYIEKWEQSNTERFGGAHSPEAHREKMAAFFEQKEYGSDETAQRKQTEAEQSDEDPTGLGSKKPRVQGPKLVRMIERVYKESSFKPRLVVDGKLTPFANSILKAIRNSQNHGVRPERLGAEKLDKTVAAYRKVTSRIEDNLPVNLGAKERKTVKRFLTSKTEKQFALEADNFERITRLLSEQSDSEVSDRVEQLANLSERRAELIRTLEWRLLRGLVQFIQIFEPTEVRDVFIHPRHADRWAYKEIKGRRPDKEWGAYRGFQVWREAAQQIRDSKKPKKLRLREVKTTFTELLSNNKSTNLLNKIPPQHPRYRGLVEARKKYREIVENGGWESVPIRKKLVFGQTAPVVSAIKKRLRAEGFFPEQKKLTDTFGKDLRKAITEYQQTHQMPETGGLYGLFWTSLNIPAERRLAQIDVNLKRWRHTNIRHSDPYYLVVNIPGFYVEVWKDQQQRLRIPIVVGNNDTRELAEEEKKKAKRKGEELDKPHPNRTPQLSAYIDRLIYNPYWNVTPRIRREEVLPKVRSAVEQSYRKQIEKMLQDKNASFLSDAFAALGSNDTSETPQTDDSGDEKNKDKKEPKKLTKSLKKYLELKEVEKLIGSERKASDSVLEALPETARKRYIFDVEKLESLIVEVKDVPKADAKKKLTSMFPYLDLEKGRVDVRKTDPDNIPKWYEQNNYEVVHPGKPREYVRMLQGKKNALGDVKIIFPNPEWVYLHDTPKQHLFRRSIRAFSHGCMRVEEPLRLAEYLLEQDGQAGNHELDKILKEDKYWPVFLEKPIPVHIDYFTVSVDAEGRPHFFADVYDYDENAFEKRRKQRSGSKND